MTGSFDPITSAANPLIKTLRGLERKKVRNETGLFLAEGARLVEQGLQTGWQAETVLVSTEMAARPHIAALTEKAASLGARVEAVPAKLMSRITRKDNAQSVIAAFKQQRRQLTDLKTGKGALFIALYEVRDPGNLGTILRTADCAGANYRDGNVSVHSLTLSVSGFQTKRTLSSPRPSKVATAVQPAGALYRPVQLPVVMNCRPCYLHVESRLSRTDPTSKAVKADAVLQRTTSAKAIVIGTARRCIVTVS